MTASGFDPYYKWLGIPPEEQPPSFYRLLGIVQFEADTDVIANAANRQMVHLRQLQQGQYAALAQRLLKEIATAKATLLNPQAKTEYDQSLIPAEDDHAEPEEIVATDFALPTEELAAAPRVRPKATKKGLGAGPLLIRVVPFLLIGIVLLFLLRIGDQTAAPQPDLAAVPAPTPPLDHGGNVESPPGGDTEPTASLPAAEPPRDLAEIDQGDAAEDLPADSMEDEPVPGAGSMAMKSAEKKSKTADTDDDMPDKMASTESDSTDADSEKAAPPSDEQQSEATKQVRSKYKAEFAKAKTPESKVALAGKLLAIVQEKDDASPRQFALLKGAISLAAAGGDFDLVAEAWNELGTRFNVDVLAGRWGTLKGALKTKNVDDLKAGLLEFAQDASEEDRYDLGRDALEALVELSDEDELKNIPLANLESAAAKFEEASAALDVLKSNPADPHSNLVAGEYFCFFKQNWAKGLVLLSRSDDDVLKGLAQSEFKQPDKPKDQVTLADAWWDFAAKQTEEMAKKSTENRAVFWYQLALPSLKGAAREKAESRAALEGRVHREVKAQSSPTVPLAALDKRFQGQVSYDNQTGLLTFVYDFKSDAQLQDFQGKATWAEGEMTIPAAELVSHLAKLKSVKMTGSVTMNSKAGDVIGSSGGLLAHRDGTTVKISSGRDSASSSEHGSSDESALPFEVDASDKLVLLRLGDQVVGKPMAKHEVGQVQFFGGDEGAVFSRLTISGVPDREWLKESFGASPGPPDKASSASTKSKSVPRYSRVKQIVVWNEHNGPHHNCGAQTCNLSLEFNGKEVWAQKDLDVPWQPDQPSKVAVDVPLILADAVRVEVVAWKGDGGGLAEVEVLDKAGKNLTTGATVIASAEHLPEDPRSSATLVDGVTDSNTHMVGYWMLPSDQKGWAEIRLLPQEQATPARPEPTASSPKGSTKAAAKSARRTVDAEIFASCDDEFEMYVNGQLVLKGKENETFKAKFAFAAGDVITVKGTNYAGRIGFACVIKFSNGQVITTSDGWGAYRPANFRQWFMPAEIGDLRPAVQGNSNWVIENVTSSSGVETDQIWGPTREMNCFLTYVVGALELPKKKGGK
jgi:hypothetical protein